MILRGKISACCLAVVLLASQAALAQFGTNVPLAPVPPNTGGYSTTTPIVTNQPVGAAPVYGPPAGVTIPAPPPAAYDPYNPPVGSGPILSAPSFGLPPVMSPSTFGGGAEDAVCGAAGFYGYFEALWLDAYFPPSPVTFLVDGDDLRPISATFGSDTGYRIGAGWRFADGWDFGFAYTDFNTNGSVNVVEANSLVMMDIHPFLMDEVAGEFDQIPGSDIFVSDEARDILGLKINIYDFEAGRKFCICRTLVLRPFGGIRFADFQHTRNTRFLEDDGGPVETYTITRNTDIDAWGVRSGALVDWNIANSGFQVFARSAVSLLYGDFAYNRVDTFDPDLGTDDDETITASSARYKEIVPVLEIAVGLKYQVGRLFVSGGWEFQNWFNVVDDYRHHSFIDDGSGQVDYTGISLDRGDIGLQGFFLRGGWNF